VKSKDLTRTKRRYKRSRIFTFQRGQEENLEKENEQEGGKEEGKKGGLEGAKEWRRQGRERCLCLSAI
jgi:hypothetical protein